MEYCTMPYTTEELESENYKKNYDFLKKLEKEILSHEIFDHLFLKKLASRAYSQEGVSFVLSQFGKIVIPFTAAICKLMGNSPDLKSRFILMDNLYEELGNMKYTQCHPTLYSDVLSSIGINQRKFEEIDTISSIRILNNTILDAVENKSFGIGCAFLGYGGELTIPNNFPYLVKGIEDASFKDINMTYWDRHGERDKEHSDDATVILCMNVMPSEYQDIKEAVIDSLTLRSMVWSELEEICEKNYRRLSVINGKEIDGLSAEYQALQKYYSALNNSNIDTMKEVWSKENSTTFLSPLGEIVKTYGNVIRVHEELFNSSIKIDVEYYNIEITILNNGFFSVGRERGTMNIGDEIIEVAFRTSRLFIREEGIFKQLHHHGSFEDITVQEKIMRNLAET